MKQFITAALFALIGTLAHATTEPATVDPVKGMTSARKTEVKTDELPSGVKKTLDGAAFTGWKPQKVYLVQGEKNVYYEVDFVRGEEQEFLKLNEQGGKIE